MESELDHYAGNPETVLNSASSTAGAGDDYFAQARARHFAKCLRSLNVTPQRVLGYGCRNASNLVILAEALGCTSLLALDRSRRSISEARSRSGFTSVRLLTMKEYHPQRDQDAAYCHGVFDHIRPEERLEAAKFVYDSLRPGGVFGLWESNPWHLGTNHNISKCTFDKDAVLMTSPQARCLLRTAGFEVLETDFLFFFPRQLRWLCWMEPLLKKVAVGGQYQVLCRKPSLLASESRRRMAFVPSRWSRRTNVISD
jgi:SAM-dependent methyltransferase